MKCVAVKLLLRFLGFLFAAGTILFIVGIAATAGLLWHYSKDLPDYSQLQDYEPPVMTRVHAADGSLLAEYAKERRLYLPIQAIPKLVTNAFVAAEDKNFYQHPGIDVYGILRAGMLYVENYGSGRRPQGASTITQQVAKNFLLTNEVSFERKIKEALLALRIERTYSKHEDPRTLSQRNLSRLRRLRRRCGLAAVFRQVGARADHRPGRLSRRRCRRGRTITIRSAATTRRSRGAITSSTAWPRTATSPPPTPRRRKRAARRHRAADRRACLCRRIFRRRSAPLLSTTITERRSSTRAACRCAPRSIPNCRCWRARPWSMGSSISTRPRAIAARSPRSTSAAIGASSSPT